MTGTKETSTMHRIKGDFILSEDLKKATIGDLLNADYSEDVCGIKELEDGTYDVEDYGIMSDEEMRKIEVPCFYCVSYWDGNNWRYDVYDAKRNIHEQNGLIKLKNNRKLNEVK